MGEAWVFGLFLACRAPADRPPSSKKNVSTVIFRPVFIHSPLMRIIRHTEPPVKTQPEFSFLSGTVFAVSDGLRGWGKLRRTLLPASWMREAVLGFPGNANLLIGVLRDTLQENGAPGRPPF